MSISRRSLLQIGTIGAAGVAASQVAHGIVQGEPTPPREDALGLLYDATLCIGCKACVAACTRANSLTPNPGESEGMYQEPAALDSHTKNIIKLYRTADGREWSFMKQQCMHCVDPACVVACPLSALKKGEYGIVAWNGDTCLGCRCCQIACPYNVPKFEWSTVNPKIVKCELCRHRLAHGEKPACTTVCPRNAVIFGKRTYLLEVARERIEGNPGRYFENRIYGEKEGGGTQALYLSHVPFSRLGLPDFGNRSIASGVRNVQESIYQHGVTPLVSYAALVGLIKHFWEPHRKEAAEEAEDMGFKEQL